jgi:hypothetical protein
MLQAPFEKCCQMLVLICTRAPASQSATLGCRAPAHINLTATASTCCSASMSYCAIVRLFADRAKALRSTRKRSKKHAKHQRERENMVVAQIEYNYVED